MAVPTTRKIYLNTTNALNANHRGDTAKLLSRHNHRLYRQGRTYEIRIGLDPDINGIYEVYALRPDWMVMKAWQKAFEAFMNNSKEEMKSVGNNRARWQDFRVAQLGLTGTDGDLNGVMRGAASATPVSITSGEHILSEVTDESGTQYTFSWVTATGGTTLNILEEYEKMGNVNTSPAVAETTVGYEVLDDDRQDLQASHLTNDGNIPPYDKDNLESSTPLVKVATIGQVAPGLGVLSTGYFTAPCGLFVVRKISGDDLSSTNADLYLEVKAGTYKGVASDSMGTARLVKDHYEVR